MTTYVAEGNIMRRKLPRSYRDGKRVYPIEFEVSGPMALFARPDADVSYEIPTASALRGIVDRIIRINGARFEPEVVKICRPMSYVDVTINYRGVNRKVDARAHGNAYQRRSVALADVCYQVSGVFVADGNPNRNPRIHAPHSAQEQVTKMLRSGKCYDLPWLGVSEMLADYVGPLRPESTPVEGLTFVIPSYVDSMLDNNWTRTPRRRFRLNVEVIDGVADLTKSPLVECSEAEGMPDLKSVECGAN